MNIFINSVKSSSTPKSLQFFPLFFFLKKIDILEIFTPLRLDLTKNSNGEMNLKKCERWIR